MSISNTYNRLRNPNAAAPAAPYGPYGGFANQAIYNAWLARNGQPQVAAPGQPQAAAPPGDPWNTAQFRNAGESAADYLARLQSAKAALTGASGIGSDDRARVLAKLDMLSQPLQQEVEQGQIAAEGQKERDALIPALTDAYNIGGRQDEQRLNALGILNSGALAEAKARRQTELAHTLQAGSADNMRAGLERQLGLSDSFRQEDLMRQMNAQALAEAQAARRARRAGALGAFGGGIAGALAGSRWGAPGAMTGFGIGSGLGGSLYGG